MPPAKVHEVIAKEMNKNYKYDELLLRIGSVAPDCWRNVSLSSSIKDKYFTHFWNYRSNEKQANDYEEFYFKYYDYMSNPICFGYLLHLITDQYWKTNIDSRFIIEKNGNKYIKLINGEITHYDYLFSYRDSLKMQRILAKKYNLGTFPIKKEDIPNFNCDIEELNLAITGLFGEKSTLNYINRETSISSNDEATEIYDLNIIINYINETIVFIKKELSRLEKLKQEYDKKVKIIINTNRILLSNDTFTKNIKSIDKSIIKAINDLSLNGYIVDLIIELPLNEYSSLKEKIVMYFKENKLNYRYLVVTSCEKFKYLKEHNYNILIESSDNNNLISIRNLDNNTEFTNVTINEVPKIIDEIVSKSYD